ncbi:MAG TPA: hypothetical protein VIV61_14570 [Candidatus Ozemobacteraceae bacterium]
MESFLQVVVFLVIVAASVWSELSKNKSSSSTDAEFGDLTAIDDFFKQQEKARKADRSTPVPGGFDQESVSLERSASESGGIRRIPGQQIQQQPRKQKKEKKRGKGNERAALDPMGRELPPLPPISSHGANIATDEGPCLDEAPALTGRTNYERDSWKITHEASTSAPPFTRQPARRWTRRELINAIVISELMNRYDVNRVYARIPDRRS